MSRLCLDSPVASHLTQFTSLSSKEGSQGSLYLISTTSGLTSTTLSLTHSIPDTESSSILLRHAQHYCASGSLHLLFLLPRKILPWISSWLSCSFSWFLSLWEKNQHDYPVKISFLSLCHCSLSSLCSTFCFFPVSITTGNITCLFVYVAVVTFSPPPQLECKLHKDRDFVFLFFFFHLSTLMLGTMSGT